MNEKLCNLLLNEQKFLFKIILQLDHACMGKERQEGYAW